MSSERPRPLTAAALALAVVAALAPFGEVFDGWRWALPVVGAAVLGTAVTTLVARRTPTTPLAVAGTVGAAVVWSLATVPGAASSPFSALRAGVFDGWSELLGEIHPLVEDDAAIMFVTLLTWGVAAVGVHVVGRHGSALGALVGVPVLLTVAIAAGLPSGLASALVGAATGAALLLVVAMSGRGESEGWGPFRIALLGAVLLVAAGFATVVGPVAENVRDDPADPRSSRGTEVAAIEVPNLLQRFSSEIDEPGAEPVMTVSATDGSDLPRLRLRVQAYDVYDGQRWIPTTDYRSYDAVPEPEILPPGESVNLLIVPGGLAEPWLPVPDRVEQLTVDELRWSEATQTGIALGLEPYVVRGTVVDRLGLEGTPIARGSVDERFLEIPADTPESIRLLAEQVSAGATDELGEVEALTDYMRGLGRDESGPPGHSLGRLATQADLGEATGAEQLAALHALMVRSLGFPSRVVVGYVVTEASVGVTDLHVWVEVPFEGRGWIATEPAPVFAEAVGAAANDEPTTPSTTVPTDDVIEARTLPRELNPDERPEIREPSDEGISLVLVAAIALLVVLAAAAIGLVLARVNRRRARRRAPAPDARALGAWAELVDRLRENGRRPAASATIDDVVDLAAEIDPAVAEASRPLADIAAEALHAPVGPGDEQADAAWAHLGEAEEALVAARGRTVTTRRLTDPRVLRHKSPLPPSR